eukprot:jgi/Botrbrau1/4801/Bobra.0325s0023.1
MQRCLTGQATAKSLGAPRPRASQTNPLCTGTLANNSINQHTRPDLGFLGAHRNIYRVICNAPSHP